MLNNTACTQPKWKFSIRWFGGWFVRERKDYGLAVGLTIKLEAFTFFNIRITAFTEAPLCFFTINNRPT
ncbi:MAG: hypothetical protein ACI93R_002301 [Flavobacteriales bacterium]|jgi:hypothetical protein